MGQRPKYGKFTQAYPELAVRRLRESENISQLCREMGISLLGSPITFRDCSVELPLRSVSGRSGKCASWR